MLTENAYSSQKITKACFVLFCFFYCSQIFILNSLEDIGKKMDIYKLINISS